jgi:hypothetical protein
MRFDWLRWVFVMVIFAIADHVQVRFTEKRGLVFVTLETRLADIVRMGLCGVLIVILT